MAEIEEHYNKIYKYCYFHLHSGVQAEDVTQETFLRYFKQTSYLDTGKQLAYLYTIARHLCIDYYRIKSKEKWQVDEEQVDPMADEGKQIAQVTEHLAIQEAVEKLSKELQEVILLRYVNELSVGMAAEVLEISRFAFYRKEQQALKLLKKYLQE